MNRLRHTREMRKLNQRQLSELSHTPQALVSAIERGVLKPWPKVVTRFSEVLGIPADELFPDDFNK